MYLDRNAQTSIQFRVSIFFVLYFFICLEKLKSENFNYSFVMLDMNMPEMSGIEVLTAVRAEGQKIPVIMCTSVADKEVVMQCIKAGANNYVVKPFKPEELQKKIQSIIK